MPQEFFLFDIESIVTIVHKCTTFCVLLIQNITYSGYNIWFYQNVFEISSQKGKKMQEKNKENKTFFTNMNLNEVEQKRYHKVNTFVF